MTNRFISDASLMKKFGLVGLFVLVQILFLTWQSMSQLRAQLGSTRNELDGLVAVEKVGDIVAATQLHRGMAVMVNNGDEGMKPQWEAKRAELNGLWQQLFTSMNNDWGGARDMARSLNQEWITLASQSNQLSAEESFQKHVVLVDQLISLRMVADESELTLDPVLSTYYLMSNYSFDLPALHEFIARLRGTATRAIASKQLNTAGMMPAIVMLTETQQKLRAVQFAFERVEAGGFKLPETVTTTNKDLSQRLQLLGQKLQDMTGGNADMEPKAFFAFASQPLASAQQLQKASGQFLNGLLEQRASDLTRSLWITGVATLLVVILTMSLATAIFTNLNSRIRRLLAETKIIASGDLRKPVDTSAKDEIGRIAVEVEAVRTAQRQITEVLQHATNTLVDTSRELGVASSEVKEGAAAQADAASAAASSVEQMTVSVEQISQHARESQQVARKAGDASERGRGSVGFVKDSVSQIGQASAELAETIKTLGESSESISVIVQVIHDIAAQTNLLALNAAIEAARAGENGRGFAVVADEVRKLAEKTSESTAQISDIIQNIQSGTQKAITHVDGWSVTIREGVDHSEKANHMMDDIGRYASEAVSSISDITNAIVEQSSASNLIAQSIESIAAMTEENSKAAASMDHLVHDLSRVSSTVEKQIARYSL